MPHSGGSGTWCRCVSADRWESASIRRIASSLQARSSALHRKLSMGPSLPDSVADLRGVDPIDPGGDPAAHLLPAGGLSAPTSELPDEAIVCSCSSVSAGAIRHAVDEGVQVVLLPEEIGGDEDLTDAIAAAASGGALVVGPAGGNADENVLEVAGVDEDGALVPDSPDASAIDLAAPGSELRTAGQDLRQVDVSGAPYAAAVAAGAAALLSAEYPQLSPAQVRDALVEGARPGPDGLPSLQVSEAVAQASGTAEDVPLIDENLVQEEDEGVPVWVWFALAGVVFVIVLLVLVLWVRRSSADPYGVKAEREAEDAELAAARAEQAKAEERPSRRKKGGRRRKTG